MVGRVGCEWVLEGWVVCNGEDFVYSMVLGVFCWVVEVFRFVVVVFAVSFGFVLG